MLVWGQALFACRNKAKQAEKTLPCNHLGQERWRQAAVKRPLIIPASLASLSGKRHIPAPQQAAATTDKQHQTDQDQSLQSPLDDMYFCTGTDKKTKCRMQRQLNPCRPLWQTHIPALQLAQYSNWHPRPLTCILNADCPILHAA